MTLKGQSQCHLDFSGRRAVCYILPVLYYHGNLHVTEGAYAGGQGFPLSQRSFLFDLLITLGIMLVDERNLSKYLHLPTPF